MPALRPRDAAMLGVGALIQPLIAIGFALRYRRTILRARRG